MIHILDKFIPKKDRPAFIFIAIAGVLNHFLYNWSGNALTALFCPVNESVWEHLKLLFFPFLFWSLWNYFYKKPNPPAYFSQCFFAVLCGMMSIVTLFYTYTGIIGRSFLPVDILIFLSGIIITLRLMHKFSKHSFAVLSAASVCAVWVAFTLCFFIFTCFPPNIPLFFS